MTYSTNETEDLALSLPITLTARKIASQFASGQPTAQKAEQVRLNTLAVCVMNDYLQMMGISTDISKSDSWNRVVRMAADVADLVITGIGHLECRPIKAHEPTCQIPLEVWSDRIGYVVVQIDESFRQATVLGFTKTAATLELPISQLRPLEDLIDHLDQLMQPVAAAESAVTGRTLVNLSRWLDDVFEAGWQTVEALLKPPETDLAFSFRSAADSSVLTAINSLPEDGIRRAKLIDLGMQLAGHPVALIVELRPESETKTNILLQVHPTGNQTYLPSSLQLIVLDEFGATFLEAQARSADNYIQLQFSGEPEERFSVKITLGNASITEHFVI